MEPHRRTHRKGLQERGRLSLTFGSVIVARRREDVKLKIPNSVIVDGPLSLNECRNIGAARLSTDLIAFIDDDNLLAKDVLLEMAAPFTDGKVGAVSPLIFDRDNSVWFAGVRFTFCGMAALDKSVPTGYRQTEAFHDVFMVRREAFEKAGGFDSKRFPFYMGEADLAERMKRLGYRFVVAPGAKVWHDIEPVRGIKSILRGSHIRSEKRAYLVGRNRLLFLRLYHPRRYLAHLFILPALATLHILSIIANRKFSFVRPYLRGVRDGLGNLIGGN